MEVEVLDFSQRAVIFKAFYEATRAALIEVCGKSAQQAEALLDQLKARFADASFEDTKWILHNDPVALAVDIAGRRWEDIERSPAFEAFNRTRRDQATAHYD